MMMSRFRRPHRFLSTAVRPASRAFESLEDRRLLSADPVVSLDWHGESVEARSGEWILGLDPKADLVHGKLAEVQLKAVERRLGATRSPAQVEEYLGSTGQFLLDVPESVSYD